LRDGGDSPAQRRAPEEEGSEEQSFGHHFQRERPQRLRHWFSQAQEEEKKGSSEATERGSAPKTH